MPLLCCDVGLVSEFRLTAGCVLMDLASPAASQAAVYANGLTCALGDLNMSNLAQTARWIDCQRQYDSSFSYK